MKRHRQRTVQKYYEMLTFHQPLMKTLSPLEVDRGVDQNFFNDLDHYRFGATSAEIVSNWMNGKYESKINFFTVENLSFIIQCIVLG